MSTALIGTAAKLAIDLLGPAIVARVRQAVEEAGGKFRSDWRRLRYVRRELRRALKGEARILRVPRSVQRWLIELLVMEYRDRHGLRLIELAPP